MPFSLHVVDSVSDDYNFCCYFHYYKVFSGKPYSSYTVEFNRSFNVSMYKWFDTVLAYYDKLKIRFKSRQVTCDKIVNLVDPAAADSQIQTILIQSANF